MNPNLDFTLSPEIISYLLNLPIGWIPPVQEAMEDFLWYSSSPLSAALKYIFLLLPAAHLIAAMWTTMFAVYTVPFRSERRHFIVAMLTTWWDTGRTIALYWAGIFQALFLTLGWCWGFVRILAVGLYLALLELATLPFSLVKRATHSSMQSGVPWVAVALTLLWSLLEAGVFSYTLYPLVSDIAVDLVGSRLRILIQPTLFLFIFLLIAGSFACIQVLVEAIQQRHWKDVIQMVTVELFVMFVEVVFLYRELVDAITPALAQQSGGQVRLGIAGVLAISSIGWIGIRGMTWFLFGRFGTPTLLSIISGRGVEEEESASSTTPASIEAEMFPWTKDMISHVKTEIGWFHTTGKQLLEAYALPLLQMIAATINFFMVFFTGRHLFRLPLKSLHAFMETGELLKFARTERTRSFGFRPHEQDDFPVIVEEAGAEPAEASSETRFGRRRGQPKALEQEEPVSSGTDHQ